MHIVHTRDEQIGKIQINDRKKFSFWDFVILLSESNGDFLTYKPCQNLIKWNFDLHIYLNFPCSGYWILFRDWRKFLTFFFVSDFLLKKSDNDDLSPLIDHLADIRKAGDKISMENEGFDVSLDLRYSCIKLIHPSWRPCWLAWPPWTRPPPPPTPPTRAP